MARNYLITQNDCQIKWSIFEPGSSWENVRNDFLFQRPQLTRWFVQLIPLSRIFKSRKFLFRVEYDTENQPAEITVARLEMLAFLDLALLNRNVILDYPFSGETRHMLNLEIEIEDYDDSNVNLLDIVLRIDIRRGIYAARALRNDEETPLLHGGRRIDMHCLTQALKRCRQTGAFSTMRMFSRDNIGNSVHHFILQVRWTNLFKLHNLNENSDVVHIDISHQVLEIILNYMYSGEVDTNSGILRESVYATELFQVIFLYEIFHMYGALWQSNHRMTLRTINYSDKRRISVVLHYVRETRLRRQHSLSFPIYFYPYAVNHPSGGVHTFRLIITVRHENLAGPWLSYSVQSQTEIPFNVHVSLEMPGNGRLSKYIHSSDYNIAGNEEIESGPILFLGCPETFFGHSSYLQDDESSKKLHFGLTFQDRTSSVNIWNLSNPGEVARQPMEVLSQHMADILRRKFKTDLDVHARTALNGCTMLLHPLHKAIFSTRVPRWYSVVNPPASADAALPDSVQLSLSNESYTLVALYIYTGKIFHIPFPLRNEIIRFAVRCNFVPLVFLIPALYMEEAQIL